MTGTPCETLECTVVDPPKTDCVAVASLATSIASVMIPDSQSTATRPATSLPNAWDAISTADGDFSLTRFASASADAATPCDAKSSASITITSLMGPWFTVAASAAPFPAPARTTAVTAPIRAPAVANSAVVLVAFSPEKSARINTVLISTSSLLGNLQVLRQHRLHHLPLPRQLALVVVWHQ